MTTPRRLRDVTTLPQWAQTIIRDLQQENMDLRWKMAGMEKAHGVLAERDWFAIPGPPPALANGRYHLWFLDRDHPLAACSLGAGDVLLVGRTIKDGE